MLPLAGVESSHDLREKSRSAKSFPSNKLEEYFGLDCSYSRVII